MKKEMLSSLGRNGNKKDVVKLVCFPGEFLSGVSRFFVSDGWSSVRNKIGRCRIKCGKTPNLMGFTLIELLVVVLIIAILAAVALPKYEMAVMRSRYATLKANVNALMDAEKIYYLANGEYTEDLEALSVDLTGCTLSNSKKQCTYPWGYCAASLGTKRVHCQNTTTLQNAYVRYWERPGYGSSTCWALTDNRTDKYNKLCEREGGVFVSAGTCTGPCVTYKLTD